MLYCLKYTKEPGFLSYYEICDNLKNGWKRQWNYEHQVPTAYKDDEWVGYDDVESMKLKAAYIVDNNLAGAMFWAIDIDDFNGNHCNQGKYPLINAVKKYFKENEHRQPTYQNRLPYVPTPTSKYDKYGDLTREELIQILNKEIEYQNSHDKQSNYNSHLQETTTQNYTPNNYPVNTHSYYTPTTSPRDSNKPSISTAQTNGSHLVIIIYSIHVKDYFFNSFFMLITR